MSEIPDRENAQTVSSKYFSTGCVMDESLTDFQEPKKFTSAKTTVKKKSDKPKKAPKRIRGQKDIRIALHSKKNELESYTKDFDNICRQAGLDVDPEQLQIAIALSKSLQNPDTNSPGTSQSLTTQDRVGKIRTTLLEYGFKVPEIKIKKASKRLKKRKQYKLLLTSEEVKKQIIADKYSQVLFQNITRTNYSQTADTDVTNIVLYDLATNATYDVLKSTDTFYVNNLLDKSTSIGNLLRDWSEIPGRPVSPKFCEPTTMNFSEIECSQDELDIVLSGTLNSCRNIIKNKEVSLSVEKLREQEAVSNLNNSAIVLIEDENVQSNDSETLKVKDIGNMEQYNVEKTLKIDDNEIINLDESIATVNQYRSGSPDLFDDDPSTVDDANLSQKNESPSHNVRKINSSYSGITVKELDSSKPVKEKHSFVANINSQKSNNTNITRGFNDFMEITECVDVQCKGMGTTKIKSPLKLSQNETKRKSNDFMEITNCVVRPFLPIEADIDLTQSPDNDNSLFKPGAAETVKNGEILNEISQNHTEIVPTTVNITNSMTLRYEETPKTEENNIDLTESPETVTNITVENVVDKSVASLDLTQSSTTSDELPFVSLKASTKNQSADNTIIIDPKNYEGMNESIHENDVLSLTQNITRHDVSLDLEESHSNDNDHNITNNVQKPEEILDLTQEMTPPARQKSKISETNISFFDDYVHNHSDNSDFHNVSCDDNFDEESKPNDKEKSSSDIVGVDIDEEIKSTKVKPAEKSNDSIDIDLTQNSESSEDISQHLQKIHQIESETTNNANFEIKVNTGFQSDIDLIHKSQELRNNYVKDDGNDVESCDSDATIEMEIITSSQRCSSLGKKDNVSIDYDEMYDNMLSQYSQSRESRTSKSTADNNTSNVSSKDVSNCSQNSEVFVISDNELDYSMHQSKLDKPVDNFLFGGISIMDELSGLSSFRRSTNIENSSSAANKNLQTDNLILDNINAIDTTKKTPVKHKRVNELATPQKPGCSGLKTVETPNNQYVIKTVDVTPKPKYEAMSLEELHSELDKFGVKPFKRKRAVQLLTHIYNQTHPTVEPCSDEESPCKRRRTNNYDSPQKLSPTKLTPRKILSPKKTAKSPRKTPESRKSPMKTAKKRKENPKDKIENSEEYIRCDTATIEVNKNYEVNETPVIKEAECNPDDWVFQKREKAKIHSCRVPLHLAFHNYVLSRPRLREAILCYEPINIDDIHKDLVGYGHRYDPKELLKYMDKKCITVKTMDNDARNQKR